jgi:thermostable 8-oxoguanine DNA glycosylase
MDGSNDLVVIGFTDAAILDEQVLEVLEEVWGCEDTEGRCTVGL